MNSETIYHHISIVFLLQQVVVEKNNKNVVVVKEEENKRNLMVVVVYSFTIHEAVLKKNECKIWVWARWKVDIGSMWSWMEKYVE